MQVVAGGGAGGAHVTQHLALGHHIALGDRPGVHVGVEGGDAVVVLDHHIVPVGVVVGGDGHHAAPGRQDLGAAGSGDVSAGVVARPAGDGVDTGSEDRCNGVVSGHWPLPAGAGIKADLSGGDEGLELLLDDLGVDAVGLRLQLGLRLLQLGLVRLDALNELVHLRLLGVQVALLPLQLVLLGLLVGAGGLQALLLALELLTGGRQLIHDLIVVVHDLADHGGPVQQVGKVGSAKQDVPVGDGPHLLHHPHPLAEEGVLLLLLGLGLGHLGLLLSDELVVLGNGGADAVDALGESVDLLLQQALLLQRLVLVVLDAVQLLPQGVDLVVQIGHLGLSRVDLGLELLLCGGARRLEHHGHHGQDHQQRHQQGQQPHHGLVPVPPGALGRRLLGDTLWFGHVRFSFPGTVQVTPAGTCGWPANCRQRRWPGRPPRRRPAPGGPGS